MLIKPLPGCSVVECCLFLETPTHLKVLMRTRFLSPTSCWRVGKPEVKPTLPASLSLQGSLHLIARRKQEDLTLGSELLHAIYTRVGKQNSTHFSKYSCGGVVWEAKCTKHFPAA